MNIKALWISMWVLSLCALWLCGSFSFAAEKRPMAVDDLYRFQRVADPQISPDGSRVVYVVTTITDPAKNKTKSNLWIAATDGSTPPRQLTTTEKKDSHPRWSPDGKRILFESTRSEG